jgi:hypothetical protein
MFLMMMMMIMMVHLVKKLPTLYGIRKFITILITVHIIPIRCQPNLIHVLSPYFIHSSAALQPFVGPWPLLQFRNHFYRDGKTPWTSDQPVARPLLTHRTTRTQNKRTQTSMSRVGFEPTIPAFERAMTVHASDFAATVIGFTLLRWDQF